ncbi:hypothetical protein RAS1_42890 [Phycisphaerae bacterium RAS1]|nr:hypothetical protein RAS1_42890 [Phycisphaerae bacterium RAS1]
MKRFCVKLAAVFGLSLAALGSTAIASEAETSASAFGRRFGPGSSAATARYEGDVGFARTETRSGDINLARGVAVGVDEDGLSLSLSNAVAPRGGPALATNFNMSIDRDGQVSTSTGMAVADGRFENEVNAGGAAGSGRGSRAAISQAGGRSDPTGTVRAETHADSFDPRGPRRPIGFAQSGGIRPGAAPQPIAFVRPAAGPMHAPPLALVPARPVYLGGRQVGFVTPPNPAPFAPRWRGR